MCKGKIYRYIRVSAKEQKADRQMNSLKEYGISPRQIYIDTVLGEDFNRPGYKRMMKMIRSSDTLVIKCIDRLGCNYDEILEQWRIITKDKKADIVVIDMPLLDTRQGKDLTGTLIADLVLQIFSYVAQREREFIHQRQAEGILAAKARGVVFGRPKKQLPENYREELLNWQKKEISARKAAEILGVTHITFLKWARQNGQ